MIPKMQARSKASQLSLSLASALSVLYVLFALYVLFVFPVLCFLELLSTVFSFIG